MLGGDPLAILPPPRLGPPTLPPQPLGRREARPWNGFVGSAPRQDLPSAQPAPSRAGRNAPRAGDEGEARNARARRLQSRRERSRRCSAGDVNEDGFSDVIIGSPPFLGFPGGPGEAHLFLGGPGGLASSPRPSRSARTMPPWWRDSDITSSAPGRSPPSTPTRFPDGEAPFPGGGWEFRTGACPSLDGDGIP